MNKIQQIAIYLESNTKTLNNLKAKLEKVEDKQRYIEILDEIAELRILQLEYISELKKIATAY
jgi:hypothetical protein